MAETEDSSLRKVHTAVEFLSNVNGESYSEETLRKYLMEKRQLTSEQVDRAFQIHKNRFTSVAKKHQRNKSRRIYDGMSSERPEKDTSYSSAYQVRDVSFLMVNKQVEGWELINDFLNSEKNYCSILECLKTEYYMHLTHLVDQGNLKITRKELDEIFGRIPKLLKFHSGFYSDLKRGCDIAKMFVTLFKFFESYAQYLKDCQQTMIKMRMYIHDAKLQLCMKLVRDRSTRRNEDMIDMLLEPLGRMEEYKFFLDKLYSWTDRSRNIEYDLLGRASRRIGRVSNYIEKYKYGIYNQNEMIKLQKFLKEQCDILAPDRVIIRRGMMTRRTSSWPVRKKQYIFFLFNDMTLWTNRNGRLKNAVLLKSCEVMPSSARNDASRKFEITYRDKTNKILRLECEKVKDRDKWYDAFKSAISTAKKTCSLAWSRSTSMIYAKYEEYSDNLSDGEEKTSKVPDVRRVESGDSLECEQPDNPYDNRYAVTSSFKIQEFKEIEPMEDNVSQVSEQELNFINQKMDEDQNMVQSSISLSPFQKSMENVKDVGASNSRISNESHGATVPVSGVQMQDDEIKNDELVNYHAKKANIIRCSGVEDESRERISPRLTVSLNDY